MEEVDDAAIKLRQAEVEAKRTGEWKTEEGLTSIAEYVRKNIKNRSGVLNENRCEYFKGDRLIRCLLPEEDAKDKKKKKLPKIMDCIVDKAEADAVAKALFENQNFFMKVNVVKEPGQKVPQKEIRVVKNQKPWVELGYYVWIWDGDQMWNQVLTGLLVGCFLLVTCFPIWPNFMKLALWYLSVTLLIVMFVTLTIRFIMFLFVWIFGFEFWVLPNLFDESLTVVDSFKPLYSFEKTKSGQMWWRLAVFGGFASFCWWAYTQPTEFDDFVVANRQFVDDLYEGNLLSDTSQMMKDNIDSVKVPSIEDLLADLNRMQIDEEEYKADEEAEPERTENLQPDDIVPPDEDEESNVDDMLDALFEDDEEEDAMDELLDGLDDN